MPKPTMRARTTRGAKALARIQVLKKVAKKAPARKAPAKTGAKKVAAKPAPSLAKTVTPAWHKLAQLTLRPRSQEATRVAAGASADTAPPVTLSGVAAPTMGRVLTFASVGLRTLVDEDPRLSQRVDQLLDQVTFTVSPRTRSGVALETHRGRIATLDDATFEGLRPDDAAVASARAFLEAEGFTVLRVGRFGITARGPARLVAETMGAQLQVMAQPRALKARSMATRTVSDAGVAPTPSSLFVMPTRSISLRTRLTPAIDNFVFTPPPLLYSAPSPTPPAVQWPSADRKRIRQLLGVRGEAAQLTGKGVRVGFIDTGVWDHPAYANHNIRRIALASSPDPSADEEGHGTAVLYNLLAIAPKAEVLAFAISDPPQDAVEAAFDDHGCRIVSCSWGWDREAANDALEATLRAIRKEGGIALFASGNGSTSWPASMPDVLSVGGVYAHPDGSLEASNFASGFMSSRYIGRVVPDVCGLCGQVPKGVYIMMPTRPGSRMDLEQAGPFQPFGDGDDTSDADGWAGASGTSSATPQVAGVVALMSQAAANVGKTLDAQAVATILTETAAPIASGRNAFGLPATADRPNPVTGHGLVDCAAALLRQRAMGLA